MENAEHRILVVDDDEAIRALLMTILRRRGLVVDVARNGAEAMERLSSCRYSVMLLDMMMPLMNGYEVLERIADYAPSVRPIIIVLTAGSEPRDLDAGLVAGSVRKPFDVDLLLDSVMACMAALTPRNQLEDCPPGESEAKSKRKAN